MGQAIGPFINRLGIAVSVLMNADRWDQNVAVMFQLEIQHHAVTDKVEAWHID
jgi:hypothetical protein